MIRLQTLGREQLRPALSSGRGADAAQVNSVTEAGAKGYPAQGQQLNNRSEYS